jgi:hypothetical protein
MGCAVSVKLWHDDIRPAPDGWLHVKTNHEAKIAFAVQDVVECSLDHDLGAQPTEGMSARELLYLAGSSPDGDGLDLVRWMCKHNFIPRKTTIHSWNVVGADRMMKCLVDNYVGGTEITLQPYEVKS